MKKIAAFGILLLLLTLSLPADEEDDSEQGGSKNPSGNSIYTFFFNIVNENFRYPLFGMFNLVIGDFNNLQVGMVNWNTRNFTGLQAAYFFNFAGADLSGLQLGTINIVAGNTDGFQLGFFNSTKSLDGLQAGFVNAAINGGKGFQAGFFNIATQTLRGVQLGFINYADSIEDGVPIGFLSIVRRGGYRAIEYGFSEFFPFTLGFKIGVPRFYTAFYGAINPFEENQDNRTIFGWGIGSIIPIAGSFFFNPEYIRLNASSESYWDEDEETWEYNYWPFSRSQSLIFYFGYNVNHRLAILAGPSLTWLRYTNQQRIEPLFSFLQHDINDKNSFSLGARAAMRLRF